MATDADFRAIQVVRFPVELSLPDAPDDYLAKAAEAVRREYRSSVRWKRLRCRRVSPVLERQDESVYVLEVGEALEFDWTWEGAIAFRPFDLDGFTGNGRAAEDLLRGDAENGGTTVWTNPAGAAPAGGRQREADRAGCGGSVAAFKRHASQGRSCLNSPHKHYHRGDPPCAAAGPPSHS